MSTWQSFPSRGWLPIGRSLTGHSTGEGPYDLSYAIETSAQPHLNGRVSANFSFPLGPRVQGLGVVCRANSERSFVAFYLTNDQGDPGLFGVRLAAFKLGRIVSICGLREPIPVASSSITMAVQFFSAEMTGELVAGDTAATITQLMPEIPFPGYSGVIRFYNTPTVATQIHSERISGKPVLPESGQDAVDHPYTVFLSHATGDKEISA